MVKKNTEKSGFPYLVDMGVSQYCPFGCKFCYTSSTTKGKHGLLENILHINQVLYDANVLEVVLGGGEPTLHPQLKEIVEDLHLKNFKVGVTTKNYNFFKSDENVELANEYINSIAFSANTIEEVEKIIHPRRKAQGPWLNTNLYIQSIAGLQSTDEHIDFLYKCVEQKHHNFTILGYKDFGFGTTHDHLSVDLDFIKRLKKFSKDTGANVGVDSIFIKKNRKALIDSHVKEHYLVGREGGSSCYIDATAMQIKPSSFTNDFVSIDKTLNSTSFLNIFETF